MTAGENEAPAAVNASSATEESPAPFTLRSHMAYIAPCDPEDLNGGATPEGQRAAQRLRTIILGARRALGEAS